MEVCTARFNPRRTLYATERMHVKMSDRETLRLLGRRFVWMTLVIYAALTLGLWIAHAAFPSVLGPTWDYDYLVRTSLVGALAFGGLYAAALALWPERPAEPSLARAP